MPREQFQALVDRHVHEPEHVGRWAVDPRLDLADWTAKPDRALLTHEPAPLKVA